MKKLLVASSATAALFAVGVGAEAHASEQGNADQAQLAETALNNPEQLNESPVQEGAYNINFEYNGLDFNFESDGQYWSWSYGQAGGNAPAAQTTTQQAPAAQQAPVAEQAAPQAQEATTQQAPAQQAAPQAQQAAPQQSYNAPQASYSAPSYASYGSGSVRLANGNTAGSTGAYAAAQMEARTGVSASVWENIIARESNGQVNAYNPSGASGLFQTMPGHGSTATVQDQINSAVHAYNVQGLSAWGY